MGLTKRTDCPHCGEPIVMQFDLENVQAIKADDVEKDWRERLDPALAQYLEQAESSGLLAAFEQAVRRALPNNVPTRIDRFFLTFIKTCVPKRVPSFVMNHFSGEFRCTLAFFAAQSIVAVVGDGRLRAFLPQGLATGVQLRKMHGVGGAVGRLPVDERDFDVWVRGKFGYVPAKASMFLETMRKKSIGEFADVRL